MINNDDTNFIAIKNLEEKYGYIEFSVGIQGMIKLHGARIYLDQRDYLKCQMEYELSKTISYFIIDKALKVYEQQKGK